LTPKRLSVKEINERVDSEGNLFEIHKNEAGTSSKTMATPSAIVDEMKCKCHKESWAAGASEVNIITVVSDFGFFEYDINLYGKGDNGGGKIYKVQCQSTVRIRSVDTYYKIGYIPVFGANYWTSSTGFHFTSQY